LLRNTFAAAKSIIMKLKILGSLLLMLLALSSFAQNGTISGKVVDEITGEEMVGVTIQVLSNGKFATTDLLETTPSAI
jgi:hypothetical protein